MPHAPSPHLAFIQQRMPAWLTASTPAQRKQLENRLRDSHRATHRLRQHLATLQAPEAFCRRPLEDALAHWFADRELPDVDRGWLWHAGQRRDMSWLEAALMNFDEDDPVKLYMSKDAPAATHLDAERFVKGVRNLDLGRRYQHHLAALLDTSTARRLHRDQDRAAFAAELSLASLQGRLDQRGEALGEAALADSPTPARPLECSYLSLFDCRLNGPLVIRLQPQATRETCLLYLPGHPAKALRQYPSLAALGQALTQMLWHDEQRRFFLRYVSHDQQLHFARRLRQALMPRFPYDTLQAGTPQLEKGQHFNWVSRVFPGPRQLWQETLDKNARLNWSATPWRRECFAERARTALERKLQDAASIVVPTAQRDAQALWNRLEAWLQAGLNLLNLASLFVPGLAEAMLVVGAAQLIDEFLEGVEAANENETDAAIAHLFEVFENLAQLAALGAAGRFVEPPGALHQWQRIGHGAAERLWHGGLQPFAQPRPWPAGTLPGANGLYAWQGRHWWLHEGQAFALQADPEGGWRLASATGMRHHPKLLGNGQGTWLLEHERPLAWSSPVLARRLGQASAGLDDSTLAQALRSSGYDDSALRRLLHDHRPLPALLLDHLEAFGASAITPFAAGDTAVLARDFPSLSPRARSEILATASAPDLARLRQSGRLPLRMAEQARLYLREGRLNRALRDLQQGAANADRDRLVFANLPRLPGWSGDIRLELVEDGRLIELANAQGATTKRVLRSASGYEPSDANGEILGNRDALLATVLRALPDSERNALKLNIHDATGLRDALFALACKDREATARDLGMAPLRRLFNPPTRLPGSQRLGYRLSGRGQGWLTTDQMFDQLYPGGNLEERQLLRQRLQHEARQMPGGFHAMLERLGVEYRQLDHELQAWVGSARAEHRIARDQLAQRIRRAWRRESPEAPTGAVDFVILDIDAAQVNALPSLSVALPHVRDLRINGLTEHADAQLDGFLRAFPRVRHLDLEQNALQALPPALAELGEIQSLDLSHNQLDLSRQADLNILVRLTQLQRLNLSSSLQQLPVSTLERLASLPQLSFFQADLNALSLGAEHFQALQRWPSLTLLELGCNEIALNAASRSALAGLDRLRMLSLRYNPLELAPDLTGWTALEQLDLERTAISDWPAGLTMLMDQQPLNLRAIDLSLNELSEAPQLRDTAFARGVREGLAELTYAFDDNPFSEQALQRLDDAGLTAQLNDSDDEDWSSGWPSALRAHLAQLWMDENWQPLFDLYQRLPGTAEYQHHRAAMDSRMRQVLQTLVTGGGQQAAGNGFAELQQQLNDLLHDAATQCVDQASLLFQQVETEVTLWQSVSQATAGTNDERAALETVAGVYRQQLLDAHIGDLYNARRARRTALANARDPAERAAAPALSALDDLADAQLSEPDFLLDELEMALYARIRLQQRLRLPAQPDGMEFEYLARLSDATLQRLEQSVWSAGAAPQLEPWLAAQHFWPRWLRRLRPQAFQAFELEWEGAAEYFDTLNEAAPAGAYNGPAVPERYIALLEAELAEIEWRQQGVLQRIDLSSDSARYQRAAELLKNSRDQALQQLMQQLTRTLSEANPQAFSPHAE